MKSTETVFTVKEIRIMQLICEQHTSAEIAHILGISKSTVATNRKRLIQKTESRNMVGIINYALRNGICKTRYVPSLYRNLN